MDIEEINLLIKKQEELSDEMKDTYKEFIKTHNNIIDGLDSLKMRCKELRDKFKRGD